MTVTRLGAERFYALSAAVAQLHDRDQLEWRKQPDEQVDIVDVTDDYGVLVLAGPDARRVLSNVAAVDLSNTAFPWLTAQVGTVANVGGVRLLRVNYVGELGWEIHVPMQHMQVIYNALISAGTPYGLQLFGTYAMNSLRMEKAYRAWGSELTNEVTLIDAGMERFVDFSKEFTGKAATQRAAEGGGRMTLVYLEVDARDADCLGQ